MKIVIIGAGVAGLSTYLFLKKHLTAAETGQAIDVTVYEAYDIQKLTTTVKPLSEVSDDQPVFTPVAIGSAVGISRNGSKVIRRLDSSGAILQELRRRGNPITSWKMSNARGWTLNRTIVAGPKPGRDVQSVDDVDETIMIARQDLWEILRDAALRDGVVVKTKRVSKIIVGSADAKSVIEFTDGTSEEADLVIGADGLKSILRRSMYENRVEHASAAEASSTGILSWITSLFKSKIPASIDYVTPHYEGLGGLGGFLPTKELEHNTAFDPKQMNIVFGHNGFFGYGCTSSPPSPLLNINDYKNRTSASGPVSAWWSTFGSPISYPYHIRPNPTPTNPNQSTTFDSSHALTDLLTRHRSWSNPTIQSILTHVSQTGLTATNFYPTWTTPELPRWTQNGRAVLVGDAAHALQPSSGQGASQALEDAEALALLLAHYLSRSKGNDVAARERSTSEAMSTALRKYEALRMPRVHAIYERSQRMGKMKDDMGFVMEMVVYFFIWLMGFMGDRYMDELVNYDLPSEVQKIVSLD